MKKLPLLLLVIAIWGAGGLAHAAHWTWAEHDVPPAPWEADLHQNPLMAFDKNDQTLTLITSIFNSGPPQVWKFIDGAWIEVWTDAPDSGGSSGCYAFLGFLSLYYDDNLHALVALGQCITGYGEGECYLLYKYMPGFGFVSISDCIPVWIFGDCPIPVTISFDTLRNRAVFVGPFYTFLDPVPRWVTIEYDGSTFYYVPTSNAPSTDQPIGCGFTGYDANSNRVIFYGYQTSGSAFETWEYDGQSWLQIITPTGPADVYGLAGLVFDQELGGLLALTEGSDPLTTWVYCSRQWSQIATTHQPSAREMGLIALDPNRRAVEFYGGWDFTTGEWLNQVWELQCAQHCKPVSRP